MERSYKITVACACASAMFVAGVANAYSIYPDTSTTNAGSTPQPNDASVAATTSSFDVGSAWGQLTSPFQNFWNSMQTISPGDFSNFNPSNPSVSIPPSVQGNLQTLFVAVLTFFSWIFGWLKGVSDWLVSLVK